LHHYREEKMGLSENKSLRFKADLAEAWRTVADKYGNDSLACEELREVLSLFGYLPQISEEALPLLVQHLDTDGDDRIAFDDFMVRTLYTCAALVVAKRAQLTN
jgi:hypothetical protein